MVTTTTVNEDATASSSITTAKRLDEIASELRLLAVQASNKNQFDDLMLDMLDKLAAQAIKCAELTAHFASADTASP